MRECLGEILRNRRLHDYIHWFNKYIHYEVVPNSLPNIHVVSSLFPFSSCSYSLSHLKGLTLVIVVCGVVVSIDSLDLIDLQSFTVHMFFGVQQSLLLLSSPWINYACGRVSLCIDSNIGLLFIAYLFDPKVMKSFVNGKTILGALSVTGLLQVFVLFRK